MTRLATGSADQDRLAHDLIQHALNVPTAQLSDVGSWHAHVPFAYALMATHRPRLVVELGVHKGDSYLTFCSGLLDHGIDGRAVGIDTWQGDPHAGEYDGDNVLADLRARHDPRFTAISTLLRKTFDEALADIEDGSVDLLHIDGLHTYDAVRHDFESWRPKLSPRGVVLFHDTVVRTGDFAVWQLWEEIAPSTPSYEFDYGNGLGVLATGADVPPETLALLSVLRDDRPIGAGSARELLRRIGTGLADRERVKSLLNETRRIESEWADERVRAMAEFKRLNQELSKKHDVLVKTNNDLMAARAKLPARIEAKASKIWTALRQSRGKASAPVSGGNIVSPSQAGLGGIKNRAIFHIKHETRLAGRWAIGKLPIGPETKVRIKNGIYQTYGRYFGNQHISGAPAPFVIVGQQAITVVDERYRDIAASARGRPLNVPGRSVSIIIPVYNQLSFTLACLAALQKHTADIEHEIIVVDDGSSDETQATLSQRDGITYIRNEKNLGFIGSCNAGAERASKTYVCFLNNDTEVLPYWLSALVNTFELHENVGLAGSKLVYPNGKLQEAGGLIWNDGSGWNWGRLKSPMDPHYCYARKADYCSGASILVPRILFKSLGGFDPHYTPAYGEDSDLAFKIRSLGLATIYQPLSQVVHHEGVTSGVDLNSGAKKHQVVNAQKLAARWASVLAHQGQPGVDGDLACDRGTIGRILVLDQITPEPDRDAGSITALELMRALRDLGYKITFVPCSNFSWLPPYTETLAALGIESVLFPLVRSLEQHLGSYGKSYDAVVMFRPQTCYAYRDLLRKHAPQARIIYHSSDLHFLRDERFQQLNQSGTSGQISDEHTQSRKQELDLIASVDVCIVHSSAEKALLEDLRPASKVVCFPWIYEPRGEGPAFSDRHDLIFLGGYGHPPNVDAAQHFIRDIWPIVSGRLPADCRFTAAGSNPTPAMRDLSGPRIDVPGFVDDIGALLFKSRVMVVPLRYGAGIKGKIIAGMAHGIPVVTTTIGAEGMGLVNEEHVLIADTPADFAAAVERLYNDEALWQRLRSAGLDWVGRTTSRGSGLKIVEGLLRLANLPVCHSSSLAAMGAKPGFSTAFGSPATLSDPRSLIEAAEKTAWGQVGAADLIVTPDNIAQATGLATGRAVEGLTAFENSKPNSKSIVFLADSTDDAGLSRLASVCKNRLPAAANAVIAFVPPRLMAGPSGYAILAPFEDRPVENIAAPVHETWGPAFTMGNRDCTWLVDRSMTAFPTIAMLRAGPVMADS